jgi:hypothetical protein
MKRQFKRQGYFWTSGCTLIDTDLGVRSGPTKSDLVAAMAVCPSRKPYEPTVITPGLTASSLTFDFAPSAVPFGATFVAGYDLRLSTSQARRLGGAELSLTSRSSTTATGTAGNLQVARFRLGQFARPIRILCLHAGRQADVPRLVIEDTLGLSASVAGPRCGIILTTITDTTAVLDLNVTVRLLGPSSFRFLHEIRKEVLNARA